MIVTFFSYAAKHWLLLMSGVLTYILIKGLNKIIHYVLFYSNDVGT